MRVHPDKNKHKKATQAFQKVQAAWAILGDPQKKAKYDQDISNTVHAGALLLRYYCRSKSKLCMYTLLFLLASLRTIPFFVLSPASMQELSLREGKKKDCHGRSALTIIIVLPLHRIQIYIHTSIKLQYIHVQCVHIYIYMYTLAIYLCYLLPTKWQFQPYIEKG